MVVQSFDVEQTVDLSVIWEAKKVMCYGYDVYGDW